MGVVSLLPWLSLHMTTLAFDDKFTSGTWTLQGSPLVDCVCLDLGQKRTEMHSHLGHGTHTPFA